MGRAFVESRQFERKVCALRMQITNAHEAHRATANFLGKVARTLDERHEIEIKDNQVRLLSSKLHLLVVRNDLDIEAIMRSVNDVKETRRKLRQLQDCLKQA